MTIRRTNRRSCRHRGGILFEVVLAIALFIAAAAFTLSTSRSVLLSLESPAARMHRLAAMVLYDEPYRNLDAVVELIDGVGPDSAAEASKLYDPDRVAVLELWPA